VLSQIPLGAFRFRAARGEREPEFGWRGCSGLQLIVPIRIAFVSILFRLRLLSVWVAGLDPIGCWELRPMASCGEEMEAGQSSVRSGGSLVLSLGHGFGGFRLNCLSV